MKIKLIHLALLTLSPVVSAQQIPTAGSQLRQLPPVVPPTQATPEIRIQQATPETPSSASDIKVRVDELRVTGAKVYSPAELVAIARFVPGSQLTLPELEAMAARITGYYRSHGYFVARAYLPAQDVTANVVTIVVNEGPYGNVVLRNQSNLADGLAHSQLRGINPGDTITIAPLESGLLRLSDIPGVVVKSTLVPGSTLGTSDLVVDVSPGRRITGSVDADNAGNYYTGEYRVGARVDVNNALGRGDVASLRVLTSGSGLQYVRLSYQMMFGRATAGVAYSRLHYQLGKQFKVLDANGTAEVASVYGSLPLIRARDTNLYAGLNYDHRIFQDRFDLFNSVVDKNADVLTANLYGNHRDNLGRGGMTTFFASLSYGSLKIRTPSALSVDQSTARTNGSYNKLWVNVTRQQQLTDILSLQGGLTAQFASKNLDPSEKMVLGGIDGVRAYPQGEGFGDQGYLANLEGHLLLEGLSRRVPGDVHLLGFVDAGRITVDKNPWYAGTNERSLSGTGVGLTWEEPRNFAVRAYYAWKLGSADALSAPDKSGRFWIQAIKYF